MGRHSLDEAPPETSPAAHSRRPEPVAIAAAIQTVLAALVTIGWVSLDDETIMTIATAASLIITFIITAIARSKVAPVSDPQLGESP